MVCDSGEPEANTGETVRVPAEHAMTCTATTSWSTACGGVISICAAVGHVVSVPEGTSE